MVLDKVINPRLLRTKPVYALPVGGFFVLLGFVSSLLIFPSQLSVVMVAISSLLVLPYVIKIFEFEELDVNLDDTNAGELEGWVKKCLNDGFSPQQIKNALIQDNIDKPYDLMYDLTGVDEQFIKYMKKSNVYTRHRQTIQFYIHLFVGMSLTYLVLYTFMDPRVNAFDNQLDVIRPGPSGYFVGHPLLWEIVSNNLKIMLICMMLSLFYGSGAVFILNYNASIAGVIYGGSLRSLVFGGSGFIANPLLYIPHTTLEILAYLLAAIAGGILSKSAYGNQPPGSSSMLFNDGAILAVAAVILVLIAGVVEIQVI